MRSIPKWLRRALVWPPIGIWFPFELYRRSHSQHHRNNYLTYPREDTESYYHDEEDWEDYGDLLATCPPVMTTEEKKDLIMDDPKTADVGTVLELTGLSVPDVAAYERLAEYAREAADLRFPEIK